jgi:hypothetical protein
MRCLWLLLVVPALAAAQTMVMIGGGLDAANDIVYGKMMELAVSFGLLSSRECLQN